MATDTSGNKTTTTTTTKQTDSTPATLDGSFSALFNKANLILFAWFLAIYLVAYFFIGFFYNKGDTAASFQSSMGRMIDFIILGVIIVYIATTYYYYSQDQKEQIFTSFLKNLKDYIADPYSLFLSGAFILIFYAVIFMFRVPMTAEAKPITVSFVETLAWVTFVVILFSDFFKYVLHVSLTDILGSLEIWNKIPDSKTVVSDASGNQHKKAAGDGKEVFNISNNLYTYDDAQAICSAYDATLATYDQVEETYNKGGEWCNYGWSDGQMILFPTQKLTWQSLQSKKGHEHDCGRPGINGGYIANPYVKFGVNCYGKKPAATDDDLARMNAKQNHVYPRSPDDAALDAKLKYWKDNAKQLLQINSYNTKKWSEY
jgi:hypothetical protein